MTGYSFDEICQMDEQFAKRVNARLMSRNFDTRYNIAQQSLLTSLAGKKPFGKLFKHYTFDDLMAFQGFDKLAIKTTRSLYLSMVSDVEEVEAQKVKEQTSAAKNQSIRDKLRERFGIT